MNKLKGLVKLHETSTASEYKQHKKDGVEYCRQFLAQMPATTIAVWSPLLENSKKKDDLADCFLQGIWYIVRDESH